MKSILIASAAVVLAIGAAPAAMAANAKTPYANIDRSNDRGNNTGDSEVDKLNSAQLDQNYKGPYYAPGQAVPPTQPTAMPADTSPATPAKPMHRRPAHRPVH